MNFPLWLKIAFLVLSIQMFVFYSISNIIALSFWYEHHDEFTSQMESWIVNYTEFGLTYGVVIFMGLIITQTIFTFLSTGKSQNTKEQDGKV